MLNGCLPSFTLMSMEDGTAALADSYMNIAVLKRAEGIGHSRDIVVRCSELRDYRGRQSDSIGTNEVSVVLTL